MGQQLSTYLPLYLPLYREVPCKYCRWGQWLRRSFQGEESCNHVNCMTCHYAKAKGMQRWNCGWWTCGGCVTSRFPPKRPIPGHTTTSHVTHVVDDHAMEDDDTAEGEDVDCDAAGDGDDGSDDVFNGEDFGDSGWSTAEYVCADDCSWDSFILKKKTTITHVVSRRCIRPVLLWSLSRHMHVLSHRCNEPATSCSFHRHIKCHSVSYYFLRWLFKLRPVFPHVAH